MQRPESIPSILTCKLFPLIAVHTENQMYSNNGDSLAQLLNAICASLSLQFIYVFPIPAPSESFPIFTEVILTNISLAPKGRCARIAKT